MDGLHAGELEIVVEEAREPTMLRLVWKGRSADRTPGTHLAPFFERVLDDATGRGLDVEMRFGALEHFNSATISVLIDIIQGAAARAVRMVLRYDGRVRWQRLAFDALRVFSKPDGLLTMTGD